VVAGRGWVVRGKVVVEGREREAQGVVGVG
jgi:hypothetical protein